MIKNILPIILTILFASCEYEDFDDNKDVESPLATCVDGIAKDSWNRSRIFLF